MVYAKCNQRERLDLWESLEEMAARMDRPWMIGGDFKVITSQEEKYRGLSVSANEIQDFLSCIQNCEVNDLGFKEKINRLIRTGSDHAPMLISYSGNTIPISKPFKFLNFWVKNETFLDKKAGMQWFEDGDRYTKFFHEYVQGRRKRLHLKRIQDQNGMWLEDENGIAEEAIRFFTDQFTKENDPTRFEILDHLPRMISKDQNSRIIEMPNEEEIKTIVFSLNRESSGGPDGFTGLFYQTCWSIIGGDITNMVTSFFNGAALPKFITHTNLVLLPKMDVTNTFSDMRPISLSNFVNKIFPRLIHERLAENLSDIISLNRAGFFKGRSIVENVLLTQEIIADIRLRNKKANVVIKLDMAKTYDRVSWLFLTKVPQFKGFGLPKWSPKVNHLAYADDMIIFSSADIMSLQLIMEVLGKYEATSGQEINKEKRSVYLHHGVTGDIKAIVEVIWWNFRASPSLWSFFISNKYNKKVHAVVAQWKYGTQAWKNMSQARELVEHHIWWQTKRWDSQFWYDNWTRLSALYYADGGDTYDDNI
ncbi:uncharacterized protein LOC132607707 [Lycium barbarum]|uniref:uncharacterized protein LOC132607707 n=1 Tax=Lycium barbarum TaxID=112863 RepID=UPI00293F4692|nr:uncharacterized protein LOC132607707 [Lycium barbarum]